MKKPMELSTRKTAAAISKINNNLPCFPEASNNSKFLPSELVELLEWSLPRAWRTKFDLDGYIPTHHPKAKLIEACEAIERNETLTSDSAPKTKSKKDKIQAVNPKKMTVQRNLEAIIARNMAKIQPTTQKIVGL